MTRSALPPHLDEAKEWVNTDWDWWGQRWMLNFKHWLAFGPRAKEWWARWREVPECLFAIRGEGVFRIEYTDGSKPDDIISDSILIDAKMGLYYLSPIQYWCRWSFQLQWPFQIVFHYYFNKNDMPAVGERLKESKNKVFFFRFGARRDSDRVYWFPSMALTLSFN